MKDLSEVNVRVAVRVRPLLERERVKGEAVCVYTRGSEIFLGRDKSYAFDFVFSAATSQASLFQKSVEQLVFNFVKGYNATVFAYGQTGSGKTYTIGNGQNVALTADQLGILPRAAQLVEDTLKERKAAGWEHLLKASYVQVYKEELTDLLEPRRPSSELHIREDQHGNTVLLGTREHTCANAQDILGCLRAGSGQRCTSATSLNELSSRSHAVFTLSLEQRFKSDRSDSNPQSDEVVFSKFHFVDLAGSERANSAAAVGERFKESVYINSGLLVLGNVISALGDSRKKASHIPYRDSKITRILKDALGGNAQTLMICCVAPSSGALDDSLNALKYAARARNIQNKPVMNRDKDRFKIMQAEIKNLRDELARRSEAGRLNVDHATGGRLEKELERCLGVVSDAQKQLVDLRRRGALSNSQKEWLETWIGRCAQLEEELPKHNEMLQLRDELASARTDLANDEAIFTEKNQELEVLRDRVDELENLEVVRDQELERLKQERKTLEENLVAAQMRLEQMANKVEQLEENEEEEELKQLDITNASKKTVRAKSVPAHLAASRKELAPPPARPIHTSPALLSVERVLAGFRARSRLLVDALDDGDVVEQPVFEKPSVSNDDSKSFVRLGQGRGTYKVHKPSIAPPPAQSRELARNGGNPSSIPAVSAAAELRQEIRRSEVSLSRSNLQLRDLALNIRMKEQLIKELVRSEQQSKKLNEKFSRRIALLESEKKQQLKQDTKGKVNNVEDGQCIMELEQSSQQKISHLEVAISNLIKEKTEVETRLQKELAYAEKLKTEMQKNETASLRESQVVAILAGEVPWFEKEVSRACDLRAAKRDLKSAIATREQHLAKRKQLLDMRANFEVSARRSAQEVSGNGDGPSKERLALGDLEDVLENLDIAIKFANDDLKIKQTQIDKIQAELEARESGLHEVEDAMLVLKSEHERDVTELQLRHEEQLQQMMQQLSAKRADETDHTRMQQLEKDLYYYKKTSRDLKRRLRIQGGEGDTHADNDGDPEEQHMVRVSRRELKRLSTEEVGLRKSQADRIQVADAIQDSLEDDNY